MEPKKMTPQALDELDLKHVAGGFWDADEQRAVLAHFAALEAEIQAWKDATRCSSPEHAREELDGLEADRERVQALEGKRDNLVARVSELENHREVLRKKAQAAESRLSAFRQRAPEVWSCMNDAANLLSLALSGELTSRDHIVAMQQRLVAAGKALQSMLGEDATGADGHPCDHCPTLGHKPATGRCECPCAKCVAFRDGTAPAPSTAEAFATVRELIEEFSEGEEQRPGWQVMRKQVSLLERRMGAMDAAARAVLDSKAWMPHFKALQDALTDAPPVVTLEEVDDIQTALQNEVPNPGEQYLNGWLDALATFRERIVAALRR